MNTIRIKRSAVSQSPASLLDGELAYSSASGNLFIGLPGNTIQVIGGLSAVQKLNGISPGATPDQTALQILTKLKTVDGVGSLLDADTVDGIHGSNLALKTDLNGVVKTTSLGVPLGVAQLDAYGLVPSSQIPSLAISKPQVAASEVAMLALTAQSGDIAIRTDLNKTFMLAGVSSVLVDWIQISVNSTVQSINGQIGVVQLTATDVNADPVGSSLVVQNALNLHTSNSQDPHGTLALLTGYLKNTDDVDGGTF